MRLVSFFANSKLSFGAVVGDGIVDLPTASHGKFTQLQSVLEDPRGLADLAAFASVRPTFKLSEVVLAPVIPKPDKILCVGLNYEEHRQETGRAKSEFPALFVRFANTLVGHGQPLIRPKASTQLDYEGELAVIIGTAGRAIAIDRALAHVAGYSCFNDASVRDWQRHTHQFTPGKNFVATGGLGPWLVTRDEVPDVTQLTLTTTVSGEELQRTSTGEMIFSIPELIAYISTFTELVPGDVIATGTPGGVGFKRTPPRFLRAGDTVDVAITGVGVLSNPVVDEI